MNYLSAVISSSDDHWITGGAWPLLASVTAVIPGSLSVLIMTSELAIDPVPIRGSMRMTCTVLHHYPYRSFSRMRESCSWVLRKAFPGSDCLVDNDVSSSTKQWNNRGYTSVMHHLQNTISRNLLLWLKTGIIGRPLDPSGSSCYSSRRETFDEMRRSLGSQVDLARLCGRTV